MKFRHFGLLYISHWKECCMLYEWIPCDSSNVINLDFVWLLMGGSQFQLLHRNPFKINLAWHIVSVWSHFPEKWLPTACCLLRLCGCTVCFFIEHSYRQLTIHEWSWRKPQSSVIIGCSSFCELLVLLHVLLFHVLFSGTVMILVLLSCAMHSLTVVVHVCVIVWACMCIEYVCMSH